MAVISKSKIQLESKSQLSKVDFNATTSCNQ